MKRGDLAIRTIGAIFLLLVGFFIISGIIFGFFSKAEAKSAEQICRGSVALREAASFKVDLPVKDINVRKASPLMCQTLKKDVPEKGEVTKENIMRDLAELMTRCWWMFGEGMVEDVFKGSIFQDNKCFECYHVTIRQGGEFSRGDKITAEELSRYMWENHKKIVSRNDECYFAGGQCIPETCECGKSCPEDDYYHDKPYNTRLNIERDSGKCESTRGVDFKCCTSKNQCENRGGVCADTCGVGLATDYPITVKEDGYTCRNNKQSCCIRKEDMISYLKYIRSYKGDGALAILSNIEPGETYTIAFGSPNEECGNFCNIAALGGAGAVGLGLVLLTNPGGLVALGVFTVGAVVGAVSSHEIAEGINEVKKALTERGVSTMYLVDLALMDDSICYSVKDIKGK